MTIALLVLLGQTELVEVRKIWDQAPHNAFTDLLRWKDRWWCSFREAKAHGVVAEGSIRVISSADGREWTSAALLASPAYDLRDPKLSVAPDGRLLVTGAGAPPDRPKSRDSMSWFSADGKAWTEALKVADPDFWLWRVAWHKGTAYGVGYRVGEATDPFARLYASRDGAKFETHVDRLFEKGRPNEASLIFLEDDTCLCLLRREQDGATGQLGTSRPPYKEWTWKDLGVRIGGPHHLQLPDGRIVAAVRRYEGGARTSLHWLDPKEGKLTEFLRLPSGGDTSYAGLVFHEGLLWVSYYSSHEEDKRSRIYLAKVRLPSR